MGRLIHNRRRLRRLSTAFLLVLITCGVAHASLRASDEGAIDERWYVVKMQDPRTKTYAPCGYMHSIARRLGDEMHTQVKTKIAIHRGPAKVEMTQDQTYVESIDGHPLSFRFVSSLGKDPETVIGTIKGKRLALRIEQYGQEKEKAEYDFDPDVRFPYGQLLEQQKRGIKPGTEYTVKSYEPAFSRDSALELKCKVIGPEKQELDGAEVELTKITTSMVFGGGNVGGMDANMLKGLQIDSDTWVDAEMNPKIMTVNMGIMQMRMYQTTKAEAMKRGAPPEMFLETFVKTDRKVGKGAERVVLRLKLAPESRGSIPDLPDTPMQSVKRISDREVLVTLQRDGWDKLRAVKKNPATPNELSRYLSASSVCDANDRKIRRLARRAVRGHSTPADKADALRQFVTDYITDKNMDVGFATASDVVRNRSGDCTEHGVLLAALCRAAGLPARGVSGIVEIPAGMFGSGKKGSAFGYHMWTQVWIDGQWVNIDAAMRETDCEPNHIALALMPLGDEGFVQTIGMLIPIIGQLEIEVVDVKRPE